MHGLAPPVVGDADDRDVGDRGVPGQYRLHLGRVDVLAAGDDQVAEPVDDRQVAVGADRADIAGAVEAVGGQRPGGGLRVVPVAGQRRGAAHLDLTALPQPNLPAQRRAARGAQPPPRRVVVLRRQRGDRQRAGLAARVVLPEPAAEHGDRPLQQVGADRRGPVDDLGQLGQVRRLGARAHLLRHRVDQGGYQLGELDPPAYQFVDEAGRVEAGQQVQVPAGEQGVAKVSQARDVEQRQRGQVPGAGNRLGHLQLHEHHGRDQLLVGQRYQLGPAGGAAGVHEDGGFGRTQARDGSFRRRRRDVGGPVGQVKNRDVQAGYGLPGQRGAVGVGEDRGGSGQPQQRGYLGGGQPPVDRRGQRPGADQAEHGGHPAGLVPGDDRHDVAGGDPGRGEPGRRALHRRGQAGIGQLRALLVGQRDHAGGDRGPPLQDVD